MTLNEYKHRLRLFLDIGEKKIWGVFHTNPLKYEGMLSSLEAVREWMELMEDRIVVEEVLSEPDRN